MKYVEANSDSDCKQESQDSNEVEVQGGDDDEDEDRKLLLCGKGFRLSLRRLAGVLVGGVSRQPVSWLGREMLSE